MSSLDIPVLIFSKLRGSFPAHPNGTKTPVIMIRMGRTIAATMPPAENSDHQIGSLDFAIPTSPISAMQGKRRLLPIRRRMSLPLVLGVSAPHLYRSREFLA